jgi:molybdenum cofactor biosynthesis protein MoaC
MPRRAFSAVRRIGTHVADDGATPRMVDVSAKGVTKRTAVATSTILFPPPVAAAMREHMALTNPAGGGGGGGGGNALSSFASKKGPVFSTAIVAATMAVKQTSNTIPFCHPLPIEGIDVACDTHAECRGATVTVRVSTTYKTGVEMEALHGATVAALTVYDMLKGIPGAQPDMRITDTQLQRKTGGKSDVGSE